LKSHIHWPHRPEPHRPRQMAPVDGTLASGHARHEHPGWRLIKVSTSRGYLQAAEIDDAPARPAKRSARRCSISRLTTSNFVRQRVTRLRHRRWGGAGRAEYANCRPPLSFHRTQRDPKTQAGKTFCPSVNSKPTPASVEAISHGAMRQPEKRALRTIQNGLSAI